MSTLEVRQYQTRDGRIPFSEWLDDLNDRTARARIVGRLDRLAVRLFGDCKPVGGGVSELRVDHGPGYRLYFAQHQDTLVILLCGGDKRTQTKDIERAHAYWKDFKTRSRS